MTLTAFLNKYDNPGAIVLLEGKRNVAEEDKANLTLLGKLLAEKSTHILFRSGNASGADLYFSQGVAQIDSNRLQIITPYSNHRQKQSQTYNSVSMDDINMVEEPAVLYQSKSNKKMDKLVDQYVAGKKDRFSIKAAYIIRDTVKVIGTKDIPPATFGIFYDDLSDPVKGGTGHTMNVCRMNEVPLIDQKTWLDWLK
jgi:hypothetical protein